LSCVICSFCGKDFVTLGRHQWRCKEKIDDPNLFVNSNNPTADGISVEPVISSPTTSVAKKTGIKCCCGKICKGTRGIKMHQRSCRVILGLNSELLEDLFEQAESNNVDSEDVDDVRHAENLNSNEHDEYPKLRRGINLPKTNSEWLTANEYFKFSIISDSPIKCQDLNASINLLNTTIYNYFAENFGYVERLPDDSLYDKYDNYSIKDLKKALKQLKSSNAELAEIRYVSRLVRNKLKTKATNVILPNNNDESFNHDKYLERNFWGYVKKVINYNESILPTFNIDDCLKYFKSVLTKINPNKIFQIPSWIPALPNPIMTLTLNHRHINK
jgi:hypothetical protein